MSGNTETGNESLQLLRHWRENSETDHGRLTLPPEMYTDEHIHSLEVEKIFGKEWICVGHVLQVANSGDYLTMDLPSHPVIVVRDRSGDLQAYSNVCPHRSGRLLDGCGSVRAISCPYHAWTYQLDGTLRGAPHMKPEAVSDVCLNKLRLEIWCGLVFVNLDDQAEALAPRLEEVRDIVDENQLEEWTVVHTYDEEFECNWKVLVENFCESYHVFRVHSKSLEPGCPTASTHCMPGGDGYNLHTMDLVRGEGATMGDASGSPPKEKSVIPGGMKLMCVYPSLGRTFTSSTSIGISVLPRGPNRLFYRAWIYMDLRNKDIDSAFIEKRKQDVRGFMNEDKIIIEGVQRGLQSGAGNSAVLNEMEDTNWEFGNYLARRLLDEA